MSCTTQHGDFMRAPELIPYHPSDRLPSMMGAFLLFGHRHLICVVLYI